MVANSLPREIGNESSFLDENPADLGVTKMELKIRFDVAWGTVDYHVENLALAETVKKYQAHPFAHLFDAEIPENVMPAIAVLRRPNAGPIFGAVDEPLQICDLEPKLGLSRTVIGDHLFRLNDVGLVEKTGQHRPVYARNDSLWKRVRSFVRR